MINVRELQEVVSLMNESGIQKLHIEHEGTKVVIDKAGIPLEDTAVTEVKTEEVKAAAAEQAPQDSMSVNSPENNEKQILSPMVGTFYAKPEADADPFVQVGQTVERKDVVCVIEAMKLFNEVDAGIEGEVLEILVKDGDVVEFGQPLFTVKTY
ncbi:acetyl-CoA carboxylase biotin carboxyl carrier protein [Priestia megaterium]|jgi:acetyl-CoA carboxylase biotin carboxyl carrier protein|uniref:Biotin carboxyl carrier protein of acetyl-CoA carboxylase n=1 Tax=Priestia megaterium (strain ATCC 14581 / DSM 32 / CCUG 1817 / JCM 2506 / NBRC 15308 / NCIMB 9376 / NCTC 10342 / NRRL B-14308 / VKM B-512 / Ford 19) TaxID=1348623 RepID=A0A0B6AI23_PRIM2|nr:MULTISPECIES: acetyl-CoA carboxylase biotin carboxyl carrier protein [Priestia]AJI20702.1 acetyl-CoA carboxylase, biotin carboxyl carrier protein [Priestia megaterium NBRC 15308 = ATCC 14581]KFM98176.1 acetyl-CoA carboxylase, biotin carboxyl carrier protein [Priestia megaterium]KGJ74191.1 acetyl-CoA carboxylase [Priestia megaterium NBRC 15308 = ATCC 14581]MBY0196931.1 acetyl-CoA carboxylase biotin carboxyl carrier protein [Priestia megaterium]MCR8924596.1 acetyl-CoA carboxylase biotin carbo